MGRVVYLFGPDSALLMRVGSEAFHPPADPLLPGQGTDGAAPFSGRAPHLHRFLTESLGWSEGRRLPPFDSLLAFVDLETARRKGHNRETLLKARREAWLAAIGALDEAMRNRPCPLHVRLMSALRDEDAVISLSRPVLLDRAIDAATSIGGDDSTGTGWGYGIGFRKQLGAGGWRDPTGDERKPLRLLKLRGSFNWLRCTGCRADYAFALEHPHPDSPDFRFPCVHPASAFEPLWLLAGTGQGGRPASFGQIWTEAIRVLEVADEIVVLGDPLLDGDLAVEWLIRRSVAARRENRIVTLVRPQGSPGGMLADLLLQTGIEPRVLSIEALASTAGPPQTLF